MSYPLVTSGESVDIFEVPNPAEDLRVVECMEAHLTQKFGGLALTETINTYREVITPGSARYLYEGSTSPLEPVCLAAVEDASEDGRGGRVLAVSTFGIANDPVINRPDVASFTASVASQAGRESTPPAVGWVETFAWDPTMSRERCEKVLPFLGRAVSERLDQEGFVTVGYASQTKRAGAVSEYAARLDLEGSLLQAPKDPMGWIGGGLRHPEAQPHIQRRLFMFNVGAVRRALATAEA